MNQKQMKEFMKALNAIAEEKKIDKSIVVEAMEQAIRDTKDDKESGNAVILFACSNSYITYGVCKQYCQTVFINDFTGWNKNIYTCNCNCLHNISCYICFGLQNYFDSIL